jgi:hypothetical protein
MGATFSAENRILMGLKLFDCAADSFVEIAKQLNVRISRGGFSEMVNGKKTFDNSTAEQLLQVLERMGDLQDAVGEVPIDWSRVERVVVAMVVRRIAQIATELRDSRFDESAEAATKSVVQVRRAINNSGREFRERRKNAIINEPTLREERSTQAFRI